MLHTTNLYPTKDHHLRLNSVRQLINTFKDIPIGLSDHTSDLLSSIVGLTLGASIIEKHFVHNKKIIGPDISSSIDENQLRELINFSKRIPVQLKGNKNLLQNEQVTRNFAYSSVVSIDKINKGEIFNRKNLWVKRPGTGYFKASEFKDILGKKAKKNIKNNVQLKKMMLSKKKIIFVTSTRADFGKLKSLINIIKTKKEFEVFIVITGMHMLKKFGSTYIEVIKSFKSNIIKFKNQKSGDRLETILAKTIKRFSKVVKEINPDLIVIHGDRVEALGCASVGALNHILTAHIEGGEISGTIDDSIRHSITKLSHIHF